MSSFLIEDWMVGSGLNLKGCELILYALIWSYSRKGKQMYESEQSLAARFGYSRKQIGLALDGLCRKGLVEKLSKHKGLQSYDYRCNISSQQAATKLLTGMTQNVAPARDKSSHNNTIDNQLINIERKNGRHSSSGRKRLTDVPAEFSGSDTL